MPVASSMKSPVGEIVVRTHGETWLDAVAADGSSIEEGTLPSGTERRFTAAQLARLTIGNAYPPWMCNTMDNRSTWRHSPGRTLPALRYPAIVRWSWSTDSTQAGTTKSFQHQHLAGSTRAETAWRSMTCSMSTNKVNESLPGLRSNAFGLIGGIALGLAAIAGLQWWQGQQQQGQMAINSHYSDAVNQYANGALPADKGGAAIAGISKGNSTLGALAALQLAKAQVDAGKPETPS